MQSRSQAIARCTRVIHVVACVVVVTPISAAGSQTDPAVAAAPTTPTRSVCWKPRPGPACRAYVPTELGYEHPVASTSFMKGPSPEEDFSGRLVLSVGMMRNRGTSSALGGLLAVSTDDATGFDVRRAEGRYRRWIGTRAGVDVGLGLAQKWVYSEIDDKDVRARGLTAGLGVNVGYIGVDARIDALRGGGQPRNAAFLGVHANSQAASIAMGALALATLALFLAWTGGEGS